MGVEEPGGGAHIFKVYMDKCTLDFEQQLAMAISASLDALEVVKHPSSSSVTFECPVCYESTGVFMLSCAHPLCAHCLTRVDECPVCRHPVPGTVHATNPPRAPAAKRGYESPDESTCDCSECCSDYYYLSSSDGEDGHCRGGACAPTASKKQRGGAKAKGKEKAKKRGGPIQVKGHWVKSHTRRPPQKKNQAKKH